MKLSVNIDHVATLRQARREGVPDPVAAALAAEEAGCDGITLHLREDRRHIQDEDLYRLCKVAKTRLNLEMALSEDISRIACEVRPYQVTIVPEKRQELTTEGGLDVVKSGKSLRRMIEAFHNRGIVVSVFIDPIFDQIKAAKESGAKYIEIHTGSYARAFKTGHYQTECETIRKAVEMAQGEGLGINAGHGLDYDNVKEIARLEGIEEVNIGHSIITRAVFVGISQAVKEMKNLLRETSVVKSQAEKT